ncbi:MAG: VRR-NUC domain-containing protein [Kangiellaceae bacterium]|jgi:hypothetical protein|nr:VRR-NUC domain-containing protein [Kangiellaceae bacterium]
MTQAADQQHIQSQPRPILPTDYYLENMQKLLNFVDNRYSSVIEREHLQFIDDFKKLSCDAQRLLTRCIMRRGDFFRLDKLNYQEITDKFAARDELTELSYCHAFDIAGEVSELDGNHQWILLFTKTEWLEILLLNDQEYLAMLESCQLIYELLDDKLLTAEVLAAILKKLKRHEIDRLVLFILESGAKFINSLIENSVNKNGDCLLSQDNILIIDRQSFDFVRLLFFGNGHQDLSEFVLNDLGIMRYENYIISKSNRPIKSSEELLQLHDLHLQSLLFHQTDHWSTDLLDQFVTHLDRVKILSPLIKSRVEKQYLRLARICERLRDFDLAIVLYSKTNIRPAEERTIRCLEKNQSYDQAWDMLQSFKQHRAANSDWPGIYALEKRISKKVISTDTPIILSKPYVPVEENLEISKNNNYVELDTIDYLKAQNITAYWIENNLFNGLFALTYWSLLFADIQTVFFNPFQTAPADLYEPDFVEKRHHQLQEIHQISSDNKIYADYLKSQFDRHQGKACRFINWSRLTPEVFDLALKYIPMPTIDRVTRHILANPRDHRSGMPDLVAFDANDNFELIEVKGPGNQLQANQKGWMSFYAQHNIPHRVVRVNYT